MVVVIGFVAYTRPIPIASAESKPVSVEAILASLAEVKGADALFNELTESAFLTSGLKSSGTLTWRAPDEFVKATVEPFDETLSIKGGEVLIVRQDDGRTRSSKLNVADYPELRSLVESVRSTLAGDSESLREHFELEAAGNAGEWSLLMTPVSAKISESIERIAIAGAGREIREFTTTEPDGDRRVMTLQYQKIW